MPELMTTPEGRQAVVLEPFAHQVGGHTCMLRYDSTTVCKPLNARERFVYESMPDNLRVFTAEYRGVLDVALLEEDGNVRLMGVPSSGGKDVSGHQQSQVFPACPESSPFLDNLNSIENQLKDDSSPPSHESPEPELGESSKMENVWRTDISSWNIKLLKKQLDKMKQRDGKCQFLMLENVAARFRHPSVLDIKMGTRQHGDDAPQEKVNAFTKRCQNSTSSALGVRICGLQVYQVSSGKYRVQDKYYGRGLDVEGFQQSLRQFLHNGSGLRTDLLSHIIAQIRQLHDIVAHQDTLRFYSSSLLIMYEGAEYSHRAPGPSNCDAAASTSQGEECPVVVRMIDFAHSTIGGYVSDKQHSGPDRGYLYGLENLIKAFTAILEKPGS